MCEIFYWLRVVDCIISAGRANCHEHWWRSSRPSRCKSGVWHCSLLILSKNENLASEWGEPICCLIIDEPFEFEKQPVWTFETSGNQATHLDSGVCRIIFLNLGNTRISTDDAQKVFVDTAFDNSDLLISFESLSYPCVRFMWPMAFIVHPVYTSWLLLLCFADARRPVAQPLQIRAPQASHEIFPSLESNLEGACSSLLP
jgi:hypothetical protein